VAFAFLDFNGGGAQRLAVETWRALDPDRYRPTLICVRGRGRLVPEAEALGVPVTRLGRLERPWDLAAVPELARALRRLGADIVHVPLYSRASPYVRLAARLAGTPLTVAHEHCRDRPPGRLRRLVDRRLADGRTRFVAVSRSDEATLRSAGIPAERIAVLPNGVDTARFRPADRLAARAATGLPADRPLVLVAARLEPRKGQVDLLAALPALRRRVPDLVVAFAGDGPQARALPALAAAAGLGDATRFLGHRSDMPDLVAAADVVALPSRHEGLPLAVLEAMAGARAVVATDVGGTAEAVLDGLTGRLVPPRAPAALAAALGDLLGDPAGRSAMAERARERALEHFDIRATTRRLMALYDGWLAERAAAESIHDQRAVPV
jgi:glycosyltransferase involved in cell wall biosynthesis